MNKVQGSTLSSGVKDLGFAGLWGGLGPRIIMIGTLTALQWFIYDAVKVLKSACHLYFGWKIRELPRCNCDSLDHCLPRCRRVWRRSWAWPKNRNLTNVLLQNTKNCHHSLEFKSVTSAFKFVRDESTAYIELVANLCFIRNINWRIVLQKHHILIIHWTKNDRLGKDGLNFDTKPRFSTKWSRRAILQYKPKSRKKDEKYKAPFC